tara:strand:- start:5410 stop:5799 length:390 start_codon:yes stop_codon:yes gene_type:complete
MIKRIASILLVFVVLYFVGFYLHQNILANLDENVSFSLQKLYLFHAGFSILICVNFQLLSNVNKISEQLGFIYLGALLFKILLFSATFYTAIISEENLTTISKISLLIPTFIFLLTEVVFVSKILNRKH